MMDVKIEQHKDGWRWRVECDDADYSGTCDTRDAAEAAAAALVEQEADASGEADTAGPLCPFCGSANLSEDWSSRDGRHGEVTDWWATCLDCGGGGPVKSSLYDAREAFGAERVSIDALRAERDAAVARAEAAEAALAAAEQRAEVAEAEAEHTTERAITVAWLRSRAETGDDPWMVHVADEIEAGLHVVMHDF